LDHVACEVSIYVGINRNVKKAQHERLDFAQAIFAIELHIYLASPELA